MSENGDFSTTTRREFDILSRILNFVRKTGIQT